MATRNEPIRRDWLAKSIAGTLLGLLLAIGVSSLFNLAATAMPLGVRAQLAMWLVPPVWFGVLSFSYLFASGWRAWLWLGSANALVFAIATAMRLAQT